MPATLTNAQMQAVINNGGSVSFGPGQVYDLHNIADLPTDEEIAAQLAAEALDDSVSSASVTAAIVAAEADDITLSSAGAFTNKTYNGLTITTSTGTLTIAALKVLTVSNTLTLTGTDGSSVAFGAGGTVIYAGGALGAATATSINGLTITTGTGTLTIPNGASLITAGAYAATLTFTGTTGVTFPTSGTLATLAGTEAFTNKTLSVLAGTGTARPTVGGVIFDHFADVASAGTDDETETMYTDNIPANTFAANGAKIIAEYSAVTVAHATATRGFAVRIAGEMFLQTDSFATVAINHISFRVVLIRKDATHLRYVAVCEASNATGVVIKHYVKTGETGAVTLSDVNALDFLALVGGVGAAAADVVAKMGTIMYFPPA